MLKQAIEQKKSKAGVVGLGYVGLPLAVEFCRAGFMVLGVDLSAAKIAQLKNGQSYVLDVPDSVLQECLASGRLNLSTDYAVLQEADTISIAVPTPLRKTKDPDVSYIISAMQHIKPFLHKGLLIVLESTTYPGTTRELIVAEIENAGYEVGKDIFVAFSPERVDPGNPQYHTKNTPKVIGGITPACTALAQTLYEQVIEMVVPVASAEEAEMVKLLENTFRAVNIGLVNEMMLMCERMKIDIWNVIDAAATKPFGFMPFFPGPGLGGHCIPLDPMYLSWKAKTFNFYNRFIELASDINGNMPRFVVQRCAQVLNKASKALRSSRILIIGMAYKSNVNDLRESPALEIYELLKEEGAQVVYHDSLVPSFIDPRAQMINSVELTAAEIKKADCVLLTTAHQALNRQLIIDNASAILDTRNAFKAFDLPHITRL